MNPSESLNVPPAQEFNNQVAVKSSNTLLFSILFFLIGIILTLAVIIAFNIDINKALGLNTNDDSTTTIQEDKDKTVDVVVKEELQYENKDVIVEYWKDAKDSATTFSASLPKGSTQKIDGTSTYRFTEITFSDEKTGVTELVLAFPHFGLNEAFTSSYFKVEGTKFTRVLKRANLNSKTQYYSDDVQLTGECVVVEGEPKIKAPCGGDGIIVNGKAITISVTNDKNDFTVADKIVSSLKLK